MRNLFLMMFGRLEGMLKGSRPTLLDGYQSGFEIERSIGMMNQRDVCASHYFP
jgi:hypothetical protein